MHNLVEQFTALYYLHRMSKKPLFCIIDASSFIFRAYYAVRPLSNKDGLPTNALFGFTSMIMKVLEDLKPEHIAIVNDTKHPSFRKEMYDDYKANRSAMPEDLIPQMPYIKDFISYLGLPAFEKKGFEADDIIGALSEFASGENHEVCIVSSDKDLMQLVDDQIYMFDTMKSKRFGPAEVEEKMGVPPEQVIDYLALVGDSSDNIPGVKGIGPKSASTLLKLHGSLDGIYENFDLIKKSKQKENLETFKENAYLSQKLATIVKDVGMEFDWKELECRPKFSPELAELLDLLEFKNLAVKLRKDLSGEFVDEKGETKTTDKVASTKPTYHCLDSSKELKKVMESISKQKVIALDTETTGLSFEAQIVGLSFCCDDSNAYYVPIDHADGKQIDSSETLKLFKTFIADKKLVGQNLKFDLNILRRWGLDISDEQIEFDTMLASYLLNPSDRHSMNVLSKKFLDHECIAYEDICGKGKDQISFAEVPIEQATEYAAEDAHVTWLLYKELEPLVKKDKQISQVMDRIELPLSHVLAEMEWEGIEVDVDYLKKMSKKFEKELLKLEKKAYEIAGEEFNLASPKQLQYILFEVIGLTPTKKTKTGFSTNVDVLKQLAWQHELPELILQHREISKLKSTYVDVLPELANGDQRVHTSYNQTVAATGRLSSTDPNLQNIPIRTEMGRKIREAFVAREDCVFVGADYSQIELRILAFMSGDEQLKQAFQNNLDIHRLTASQVFEVEFDDVSDEQRRQAKAINFGILYGKTAFSLAQDLGITRKEATDIIDRYFNQFPTIRDFIEDLKKKAKKTGYAETLYGRKRLIDGIHSKNKILLGVAERMAVNTPLQGTAADIIKLAMNSLAKALKKQKFKSKMLLQVHDELVLEVPKPEVEKVKALLKKEMEGVGQLVGLPSIDVPLSVDLGEGSSWFDLK